MTSPMPAATAPFAAAAVSGHLDTRTAATEVAGDVFDHLSGTTDLAIVFGSFHHTAAFTQAAESIRQTLTPRVLLGVSAESVLGVDQELEGFAGMSILALRLPDVRLHTWRFQSVEHGPMLDDPAALARHVGIDDDLRMIIMFADPFSTPIARLLPALNACAGPDRAVPIVGGIASGASQPGLNVLAYNDQVLKAGAIGVTISGPIEVETVVSQGCRPVGRTIVVTKAQNNVIQELAGRPALEVVQEMTSEMTEQDRQLLAGGLLVGTVINEYKDRHGRGDFLVRNILGYDKENGAIAVGDVPRVGQTIQFHVRDADTAHEDLQLLLDAQQLREPALGGLLVTCNGRGSRLFTDEAQHDLKTIRDRLGEIPIAGFFAAGEIGPIGTTSFLHGHTASLALFRAPGGDQSSG